jgi:hypothetical protein
MSSLDGDGPDPVPLIPKLPPNLQWHVPDLRTPNMFIWFMDMP